MVHRTEVLNRTLVSHRYFCNHCLNFFKAFKVNRNITYQKNTTITLYTTSCYSSYHHKHTFSDDQATFISWYWVFNWGNSRHICWGTSRGWTSSLSRLNIKSKLKYFPWLNAFYIHMYIDTKKWNTSQFDQQLRYKWRNELQGELQFKKLQKRSKKNLNFGGIQICEISAIPLFSTHLSRACLISGHISLGQHLGI